MQGFVPDKVITLYGVNDAKNMSWSSDISIHLDKLYKENQGRDLDLVCPRFDYPFFDDSIQEHDCFVPFDSDSDLLQSADNDLMKYFCFNVEALNKSFYKFCTFLQINYESWLQPIPLQ